MNSQPTSFCSIAQFEALERETIQSNFPEFLNDFYFFHAPKLSDRGKVLAVFHRFFDFRKQNRTKKCIYITHELSEAPVHWRLRQWVLMLLSDYVVTHTKNDAAWVQKWLIASEQKHIQSFLSPPIVAPEFRSPEERAQFKVQVRNEFATSTNREHAHWILFSGLFTSDKGIETVIELAKMNPSLIFVFAGSVLPTPKDFDYGQKLLASIRHLPNTQVFLDLDSESLSRLILASDTAILPYQNGLSERRSSFKVPYTHGIPVLTTFGPWTPEEWIRLPGVYGLNTNSDFSELAKQLHRELKKILMTEYSKLEKIKEFQSKYTQMNSMKVRIKKIIEKTNI